MHKIKILNLLVLNGKKKKSEHILLKVFKNLQKLSNKQSKKIIKLALIFSTPFFKIHKIINKKRKYIKQIPTIIINEKARISLAVKFILKNINDKKFNNSFYVNFYKNLFSTTRNQGFITQKKNEFQKEVLLLKKHFLFFYR